MGKTKRCLLDLLLAACAWALGRAFPSQICEIQRTRLPSRERTAGSSRKTTIPEALTGMCPRPSPEKGIHSVFYKDGPAGVGETAWPGKCCWPAPLTGTCCGPWATPSAGSAKWARWTCGWPLPSTFTAILWAAGTSSTTPRTGAGRAMAAAVLQGLQENHNVLAAPSTSPPTSRRPTAAAAPR